MDTCKQPIFLMGSDIVWVEAGSPAAFDIDGEMTISQLAERFGVTPRALRFYESKGLLSPRRQMDMRLYNQADADRLALILKAKKLGFTLVEIRQLVDAHAGNSGGGSLKLSRKQCLDQIALLEQQRRDCEEALAELRRMHAMLSASASHGFGQ